MSRIAPIRPLCALALATLLLAVLPAGAAAGGARTRARAGSYPAENSRPRPLAARARPGRRRAKPRGPVVHGNALRALLAFEAMQRYYYISGSGLYAGEPFSYLFPFSQALASTVSLAHVPALSRAFRRQLNARLVGLRSYLANANSAPAEATYRGELACLHG